MCSLFHSDLQIYYIDLPNITPNKTFTDRAIVKQSAYRLLSQMNVNDKFKVI